MKYSVGIHANRLRWMLRREEPCGLCPAAKKFNGRTSMSALWDNDTEVPCYICREFVDIKPWQADCPCRVLGKEEALKRTVEALEEYYYEKRGSKRRF